MPHIDRPHFGPELPPEMAEARYTKTTETTASQPSPSQAEEHLYPNDGKWRPSTGFMKKAPRPRPYQYGGSPSQTMSRVVNGHHEIAAKVDPQYLRDTGMTTEEALEGPMAKMRETLGLPPGSNSMDIAGFLKDKILGNYEGGGEPSPQQVAEMMSKIFEKDPAMQKTFMESMIRLKGKENKMREGYEGLPAAVEEKMKLDKKDKAKRKKMAKQTTKDAGDADSDDHAAQ